MTQRKYTTGKRTFQHLTKEKRAQIEILLRQGLPKTQIAKAVGIARSTLYQELVRGTVEQMDSELRVYRTYLADTGQCVYEENRKNSRPPLKLMKAQEYILYAEQRMLQDKMAPDPLCGRARLEGNFDETVCAKTLYNYIDQGLLRVKNIDLPLRVRRKRKASRLRKHRRCYGESIDERPLEVESRETFGHWEIDTVIGSADSSEVLLTLDERMTRKRHIVKLPAKTAKAVEEGLKQLRKEYGKTWPKVFRTITCDNGSEFASLSELFTDTKIYYAHPYSAWERGTNEKQNSLIHRFFPKGKSFTSVSEEAIKLVEDWINNLPRKFLEYHSPYKISNSVLFDYCNLMYSNRSFL